MKSIFKKFLMSLGLIALLFFSNTAADAEGFPQHNKHDCLLVVF